MTLQNTTIAWIAVLGDLSKLPGYYFKLENYFHSTLQSGSESPNYSGQNLSLQFDLMPGTNVTR